MVVRLRHATNDTFRSLQHRNFRVYFATQAVSFTGTWLQLVAQTLLVLRLTDSGTALGLLAAAQFGPILVLGAWAGVVLDRYDKRRIMTITGSVMMTAALTLGVLVLLDAVTVGIVYALAFVLGIANSFDNPARRTLVNDLVPTADVANAVSLNSTVVTVARIVGPAIAGLLVTTVGIGWCFVLNALTYAAPIAGLYLMDAKVFRAGSRVARAKGQMRDGLRYVWSVDDLRVPLLLVGVIGVLAFNYQVILPLFATRELGGTDSTFTVLMVLFSIGSLIGSLRMARRRTIDTRFLGLSAGLLAVGWTVLAASPGIVPAAAGLVLLGYAGVSVLSGGNAVLQLATVPEMRGRVMALFTVVFLGSAPIGGPIVGSVAESLGTRTAMTVAALSAATAAVAVLRFLRRRAAAPAPDQPTEPALQAA